MEDQAITLIRYTPAWEVGTGLRVSLAPGEYGITAENMIAGYRYYYTLNGTWHVLARELCQSSSFEG